MLFVCIFSLSTGWQRGNRTRWTKCQLNQFSCLLSLVCFLTVPSSPSLLCPLCSLMILPWCYCITLQLSSFHFSSSLSSWGLYLSALIFSDIDITPFHSLLNQCASLMYIHQLRPEMSQWCFHLQSHINYLDNISGRVAVPSALI